MTNKTGAYIVFGCIAGIIIIVGCYWYCIKKSHTKVVPIKEPAFV
jgi:CO dehydrogenase/acetyl-CoA synthase alpha subunit